MQTRVVNKFKEPYGVYIGRGSEWGNPFTVEDHGRDEAIRLYEKYMRERLSKEPGLVIQLLKLRGKVLGCFCHPKPCHGDVLITLIEEYYAVS